MSELDDALVEHLIAEFAKHGERAVDFLRTATGLVESPPGLPRDANTVAYSVREALKAISDSQPGGPPMLGREAAQEVMRALKTYRAATLLPGEDEEAALASLARKIDDMEQLLEEDGKHHRQLTAVMLSRYGNPGAELVDEYQVLIRRADEGVHRDIGFDDARALTQEAIQLVRRMFLPPRARQAELEQLAARTDPNAVDVALLRALLASPNHLYFFLANVGSVQWVRLLVSEGLLDPPVDQSPWPLFAVIPTLRSVDEAGLVDVLTEMTDKWETDHDARMLWWPARAALDVGPVAHHLVLRAVKKHPDNDSFVVMALSAVEVSDPTDDFVLEIADAVLNPVPWDANNLYVEPILTSLVDGVTASNCLERMRMLSYKLKASPDDHFSRRLFRHDQGSVDRPPRPTDHHPFNALLQTYLGCARAALELVPLDELLESMDVLPDDVRYRFRAWAISKSASADTDVITRELVHAIRSRQPTDDDRALINRLTEQDFGDASWQDALGRPPSPADVGRALNERDVPAEWARAYGWSVLLPDEVVSDEWRTAVSILSGSWGPPTTEMFRPHPSVGFESSRSPRDGETLAAMSPESAANWIGRWRSTDWMVTPRELGLTLEEVVKAHPQPWGSNPIRIASLLIHPTYIHHYLAGLSASDALSELDPEKLMQLVSLVRTQPWPVAALGSDSFDYDADWSSAEDACVKLIKALADADAGFGQSKEAAWDMLVAKIDDRHDESAILDDDTDYLALAINRPSTRAIDAALSFLGYEFRSEGAIAENRLDVFTRSLELRGADGAQHRALIVPKIGFLNYVASEWVEQHREELFGAAAPDALGQTSIDLAVKWGLPNAWLMEHFQTGVLDAVRRDVDNALEQMLIAMLGQVPGYQVSKVVQHLRAASLLSEAGESLGRLLRRDDITSQHAEICIDFWRGAIEARGELKGFGWMSEVGAIPDDTWAGLTLDTLNANDGRIDWAQEVAKRVDGNEATITGLAIYNQMVRNVRTPWDYRRICESARSYLARASDQSDSPEYRQLETGLLERGF